MGCVWRPSPRVTLPLWMWTPTHRFSRCATQSATEWTDRARLRKAIDSRLFPFVVLAVAPASSVVTAGATANTTEGNSRASRESVCWGLTFTRGSHPPGRGRWHAPSSRHLRALLSVCGGCSFGGLGCCSCRVCVCRCRGCCSRPCECVCVWPVDLFTRERCTWGGAKHPTSIESESFGLTPVWSLGQPDRVNP